MLKDNEKKRKTNPNNKAYMNSYEWNYMVLELVDYIEEKLSLQGENDDDWKYFKEYCSLKYLNWRVIKKMIEYSVVQVFTSEAELTSYEGFKPLELKTEITLETLTPVVSPKEKPLDLSCLDDEPVNKKVLKKEDGVNIFDYTF